MDFNSIINSIDLNYVYGILLVFGLFACRIWLLPYLHKFNINKKYYNMIEEVLLLGGTMFRSEKVKIIINIALGIVSTLEILDGLDSTQKHSQAVGELAQRLMNELGIELKKDTLDSIVHLIVAFMGDKEK